MRNRYIRHAHLSEATFRAILKAYCLDGTASQCALWTDINRNTINRIFGLLRRRIIEWGRQQTASAGIFEVDESYFGARRVRGKRGRGAAGKTPVFGLLKRGGQVLVTIIPNCSKEAILPIIQGTVLEGSTIHSDGWKAYDGLILNGYDHYRVFHSHNEFARGKSHVNGIEAFWSFAKRRLTKFNGLSDDSFYLHLKESEFRYNHRDQDLYQFMLIELKKSPL